MLIPGAPANDFAAANLGQVKAIAVKAVSDMNAKLPDGAGTALNDLVASWGQPPAGGTTRNDYAAVNQGQLKALTKLFYDRLASVSYAGPPLAAGQTYPWTAGTTDDASFAGVNLGQVKYLFSFLSSLGNPALDTDKDGMKNGWEGDHDFDPLSDQDALLDLDVDGWTNVAEHNRSKDPSVPDAGSSTLGGDVTGWPGGGSEPPPAIGTTTGTLAVDKNGAATYTIPLWVVPGTAGMQPQLALNYSSQAGAGWLGFGWSLSGLSAITRGPQTMAVDANVTGVDFSGSDRFYLDGQRLIAVGTGSYGADGMEYRTEIDSISKIVAKGTAGSGPAWFEVKTKAGLIIELGHTGDSAVDVQDRDEKLAWAVNKISDTAGNYMEFVYTEDADGHRINRINYTRNGANVHYASVRFIYESRSDVFRGYISGHPVARMQRLKSIAMYYGETTKVREYIMEYANRNLAPNDGQGRSLLTSVQEKAFEPTGAETAYPLLTFDYETAGSGWTELNLTQNPALAPPTLFGRHQQANAEGTGFVDLNGDGRPDLVQYRIASNGTDIARGAWLNTPSGWEAVDGNGGTPDYRPPQRLSQDALSGPSGDAGSRFVDLNGDGLPDFVDLMTGKAYLNTPDEGFVENANWSFPDLPITTEIENSAKPLLWDALLMQDPQEEPIVDLGRSFYERSLGNFMDVDGDGRPDFVGGLGYYKIHGSGGGNTTTIPVLISERDGWRNTGSGWERKVNYSAYATLIQGRRMMDVNADGRLDVVQYWDGSNPPVKSLRFGGSDGWGDEIPGNHADVIKYGAPLPLNTNASGNENASVGTEAADLNGDGLLDLISRNDSPARDAVRFNTGDGWITPSDDFLSPFLLNSGSTPQGIAFLDVNSDGLVDIVKAWETSPSAYDVRLGTGSGWSASATAYSLPRHIASNGHPTTGTDFVDFDGDGAIDQIWSWEESSQTAKGIALNNAKPADRLNKITNGFGVVAEITYAPLTEPNANPDLRLYTKEPGGPTDTMNVIGPMYVVKTVLNDDGAGGQHAVDYRYGGLRAHRLRGSLGFEWTEMKDSRTNIISRTTYKQEYPFIGMVASTSTKLGGVTLATSSATYAQKTPHTGVTLPYAATSVTTSNDLAGTLISTTTTEVQDMDNYGNVKALKVSTTGGFEKTTTNRYDQDDVGNWRLGRLTKSVVLSSKEAGATDDITRTSAFLYDETSGLLTDEAVEPVLTGELLYSSASDLAGYGPLTVRTHYTYDAFGNKEGVTVRGLKLQVANDGTVTSAGELESRTATTLYDTQNRLPVSQTNALGQIETYGYTDFERRFGMAQSLTGPNLLPTNWAYDAFGQKTGETRADNTITSITPKWVNAMPEGYVHQLPTFAGSTYPGSLAAPVPKYVVETTSSGAPPSRVYFDKLGREILAVAINGDGKSVYQNTIYDSLGRVYARSTPYYPSAAVVYYAVTSEFDVLNRPKTLRTPSDDDATGTDQQSRTYVESNFTYSGLTTTATDPLGRQSSTTQNTQGWAQTSIRNAGVATTAADYAKVSYTHDALGNLLTTTTADVLTSTLVYDLRGRKTTLTDADMGMWQYRYNPFGELIWQKDGKSGSDANITRLTYDALGRLKTRVEREGTTTWTYDLAEGKGVGKLAAAEVRDTTNAVSYAEGYVYDDKGRLITAHRTIDGTLYSIGQQYDSFSRPTVTVYPTGFKTKNYYNTYGFLREVRRDDSGRNDIYWQADDYDVSGRLKLETYGNGLQVQHGYSDLTGRLKLARVGISGGQQVQYLQYTHDRVGNVGARTDGPTSRSETFGYDGLDRLDTYSLTGGSSVSVTYDQLGNIATKSDVGTYAYAGPRPHAMSGYSGGPLPEQTGFVYDANGNMTSGAGRSIAWTSFNQVQTVSKRSFSSTFSFGAGHERVKQVTNTGTTTIHVGSLYEKVTNGSAFEHKHYIFSPAGRMAVYTERSDLTQDVRYFHTDGLGSITGVTNEMGAVVKRFAFDAWGKRIDPGTGSAITGATSGAFTRGFTDHEQLDDLGLVHMNGRVYDPTLGRFLSADPFVDDSGDSQAFNRYSYVSNNPLNATDPSGYFKLSFKTILKIVAVVVISVVTYGAASAWATAAMTATAATATTAATFTIGGMAISATTAGVLAGAVGGAAAGFASGFAGSLLNGGSVGDAFKSGVVGAAAGILVGGVQGYFGNTWNAARVAASGVAGGAGAEIMGSDFRTGFYMAAGFAALRWGWEGIKNSVDRSAMTSTYNKDLDPNAPSPQQDENGFLRTDGKRPNTYAQGVKPYSGNRFTNAGMAAEGSGLHDYDPGMWMERRFGVDATRFVRTSVNLISKVHDWQNSWNYDHLGRYIMRGEIFDTVFQGYSFLGMPVAAGATGALFVGNSPWAQQQMLRERGR